MDLSISGNALSLDRIVTLLNAFLSFLLSHHVLGQHELINEFLLVLNLEPDMMHARTRLKLEYQQEQNSDSLDSKIDRLDQKITYYESVSESYQRMQVQLRTISLALENTRRERHSFSLLLNQLGYALTRPDLISDFLVAPLYTLLKIQEVSRVYDMFNTGRFSEVFQQRQYFMSGGIQGMEYMVKICGEYKKSWTDSAILMGKVERLGSLSPTSPTHRLKDAYDDLVAAKTKLCIQAESVNSLSKTLEAEMAEFNRNRQSVLSTEIDTFAKEQFFRSKKLEQALHNLISSCNSNGFATHTRCTSSNQPSSS